MAARLSKGEGTREKNPAGFDSEKGRGSGGNLVLPSFKAGKERVNRKKKTAGRKCVPRRILYAAINY